MIPLRDRNNHSKFSVLLIKIPASIHVEYVHEIMAKTVNIFEYNKMLDSIKISIIATNFHL